jgi:hypothetical protein
MGVTNGLMGGGQEGWWVASPGIQSAALRASLPVLLLAYGEQGSDCISRPSATFPERQPTIPPTTRPLHLKASWTRSSLVKPLPLGPQQSLLRREQIVLAPSSREAKTALLVNSANLCKKKRYAKVELTGQNGRLHNSESSSRAAARTRGRNARRATGAERQQPHAFGCAAPTHSRHRVPGLCRVKLVLMAWRRCAVLCCS